MSLCCSIKRVQLFALLVAGCTIITILMILFFFNYPHFARLRTIDAVIYKNDTEAMDRFLTTKDFKNLRLSLYVFNITNYNEVVDSSAKINLKEIGPFVYSEYKVKELVNNNQTSGLITYRLRTRYTLDRNLSIADPKTTEIFWPNVPLLVAKSTIDQISSRALRWLLNRALDEVIQLYAEPPFINDTVDNFIFSGSERRFFAALQDKLKPFIKNWPLKDNKFALLYKRNDTIDPSIDHKMTMSAGFGLNQTYHNLNSYVYFNGSTTLPYWKSYPASCNAVGGTDGQAFPPFLDPRPQILEIYLPSVCRKLQLKFKQNSYSHGIPSLKYTLDKRTLQSGKRNQENQCYCLTDYTDISCSLDGLIDLSTCVQPNIFASGAHFFSGSPELRSRLSGLTAPNSTHEPVIIVEPNTGLVVEVYAPLQFNVKLESNVFKIFNFFQDKDPLYIPLLWVTESAELTGDQASLLRSKLLLLDSWFVTMVLGGAIVLILAILIIAIILCIRYKGLRAIDPSEIEPLISPEVRSAAMRPLQEQHQSEHQQQEN